jgi:hypothetical protein
MSIRSSHGSRIATPTWRALFASSLVLTLSVATLACGGGDAGTPGGHEEWQAETTVDGDVTTVRTISGSVWGAPAHIEETLSIGVDQGEEPYMFGRISGVAGTADRIYVLDTSLPAVRVYDDRGQHLMDIGAEGDGPGEFRNPDALLVAEDGRVFVRDSRQGRITVFDAGGGLIETRPLDQGFVIGGSAMVMTHDGKVYSPGRVGDMPENMTFGSGGGGIPRIPMGMVPRGPDGNDGEPIPQPEFDYEPPRFQRIQRDGGNVMVMMRSVPFAAEVPWALSPSGAMVSGVASDYSFDIIYPGGGTTRVAMADEPIAIGSAERAWHLEQVTAQMREGDPEWVWEGPEMATVKPAFIQLITDLSGRVWVGRAGVGIENPDCEKDPESGIWEPACWTDERLYDVFDLEGAYLGSVEIPAGFRVSQQSWIKDDEIVASIENDLGVITVKKYRLVIPAN